MAKVKYTVTLDEGLVEACQKECSDYGGKLSPLINKQLKKWLKEKKDGRAK